MKNKKKLLFCCSMLGIILFSNRLSVEVKGNEREFVSSTTKSNQNIAKYLEIKQSEHVENYRARILDNWFGPSTNQSTGIYKRAHEVIEIYVDEQTDQRKMPSYTISGIALNDYNEGANSGKTLKKGKNIIAGSMEGIIHIQNETEQTAQGSIHVEIRGGITVPRFILGETTNQEWQELVSNYPDAPGYELVGDTVLITGSNESIHLVKDPTKILETQEKVVRLHDQTAGLDGSSSLHRRPTGLVQHMRETKEADAFMYAFYQHTAYHTETMDALLEPEKLNQWGMWHEIGHTYQMERMDWHDMVEVTVNIYSLRAQKAFGQRSRLEEGNTYREMFNYLNQTKKEFDQQDVWMRLGMFWQLELAFGEDFYPNLHKRYREEQKSLSSEQAKRQYFVVSASKISGKNLTPFFEQWGIEVTNESKKELAALPKLTKKIWEYRDEMTGEIGNIEEDTQAPTIPTNIVATVTSDSVQLRWNPASDNVGVTGYNIYRNGQWIAKTGQTNFSDLHLNSNTTYTYQISAYDAKNNESDKSQSLTVVTKEENSSSDTWAKESVYVAGDIVTYKGITYRAKWWNKGAVPGVSDVWEAINEPGSNQQWSKEKAYVQGDIVIYNGVTYRAKWWVKGETPDTSQASEPIGGTNTVEKNWNKATVYVAGDTVTYNDVTYQAKWWNKGEDPAHSAAWRIKG